MSRMRLDQMVVERGLAESREKAQRLIRAGEVKVNDRVETKPSHTIDPDSDIQLIEPERFVGRGGEKLEGAFQSFDLRVEGLVSLDVGASTGGFTDCLLQHGASHVYAVDVGKGQLHWRLRNDERVTVMEGMNARYLSPEMLPSAPSFAVMDVSFISLTKILPAVTQVLTERAHIVTLIKPQFEAGRKQVQRGGVVRDPEVHHEVVERIKHFGTETLQLSWIDLCESPIRGPAGNLEFLAYWRKGER